MKREEMTMKKKKYQSPHMESLEFEMKPRLLFGSGVDSVKTSGLISIDVEPENPLETDPQSIWKEAW